MIRMNSLFVNSLHSLRGVIQNVSLDPRLEDIVRQGFVSADGYVLLRHAADTETNVIRESFPDLTGYECFLNRIHLEDHADDRFSVQALVFAARMLRKWVDDQHSGGLVAIVSADEERWSVSFHCKRPGEQWLANDLDGYEREAVLEIGSSDTAFFEFFPCRCAVA